MALKLNVGCGRDYRAGWVNIDVSREVKTDLEPIDIRTDDLPYETCEVSEIYCSGVLEQILKNEDLVHALNEMHRVLETGGTATIIVPSARYSNAFRDPHDCRQFTEETFEYFLETNRLWKEYGSVYGYKGWSGLSYSTNARGIMTAILTK